MKAWVPLPQGLHVGDLLAVPMMRPLITTVLVVPGARARGLSSTCSFLGDGIATCFSPATGVQTIQDGDEAFGDGLGSMAPEATG